MRDLVTLLCVMVVLSVPWASADDKGSLPQGPKPEKTGAEAKTKRAKQQQAKKQSKRQREKAAINAGG